MGWREVWAEKIGSIPTQVFAKLLAEMNDEHRIALARELLAGTGWVVARDVGESDDTGPNATTAAMVHGWNACRAAMMGEGE